MSNKDSGFTMVELIVTIAIVGILAAIAVPRFINQASNARAQTLQGLAGALNSATSLAQAEYIAEGYSYNSAATSINMNGTAVTVIAGTGRPAATAAGIGTALQTLSGFTPTYASGVATFNFTTSVANCYVTYTDSPTGTNPVVAVVSSGC